MYKDRKGPEFVVFFVEDDPSHFFGKKRAATTQKFGGNHGRPKTWEVATDNTAGFLFNK